MLFQIFTIIILVLFYGCYLYKMIMQRKQGIQTDQLGKGKIGIQRLIEMILKVVTYLIVVVEVISIMMNTNKFPVLIRYVGLILSIIGLVLFIITVYTMKDSWRAGISHDDKTTLVTLGIFQISRNPAFLGFDMVYIGIVCMFFNIPLFVISVLACFLLHLQIINNEEPFLIDTFGKEYLEYKKQVNRYLGKK